MRHPGTGPIAPPRARIRILVVEENRCLLLALLQLLATEPAVDVIGSADSAEEALAQLAALDPQLVLIDWGLHRSAAEAICRVMRLHPAAPKVVALFDDKDEDSYRVAAAAAGADGAVPKGELSEAILPLLDALFAADRRAG